MAKTTVYLISYDISNPRLLKKVAKYLETRGVRKQKSLFMVRATKSEIQNTMRWLDAQLGDQHHVLLIPICPSCFQRAKYLGPKETTYKIY